MSGVLLVLLAATALRIESVAVVPVDGHPGLVVSAHLPLPPVVVSREGRRLRVRIPGARLSKHFDSPRLHAWKVKGGRAAMKAEGLKVWQARDDVLLQFTVGPDVPFGVHQDGSRLRFSFREPDEAPSRGRSLLVAEAAPAAAPVPTAPPAANVAMGSQTSPPGSPAFAALRAAAAEPVTVTLEKAGPKAIVRIRGGSGLPDARVRREGGEVIVTFDVGALAVPPSPAVEPPVDGIHVEKVATLAVVQVKIAPEVPFEIQREPRVLSLTFGEENPLEKLAPAPPVPGTEAVDVAGLVSPEIYRGLFPATFGGEGGEQAPAASDLAREGLQVGPVHLRPSLLVSYIDGEYTLLDTPDPVSDRYLQVEPRVSADIPLLGGELTADYGVRLRFFSQFDEVNSASHILNAGLEVPLGSRTMLRLRDHFSTGILEATEVDPGQEYFFDLSRFHRNEIEGGARVEVGSRGFLDGSVGYNEVAFEDPQAGFFPYDARFARVGAGLTFGDNMRAGLYYGYDRIPSPAARELVAATGHSLGVTVEGDFGALTTGQVTLDYTDRDSPGAGVGGQNYRGLVGGLSLSRELSPTSRITVTGRRSTDLSAFEDDAFYVSTGGRALLSFGLPWSLSANTGVGYQENSYRTEAAEIGVPREDSIFGWTLGLSRPVGSFAYLRADYRRDRRRSNIPAFNITTDGFIVQVGVGLFGTSVRR